MTSLHDTARIRLDNALRLFDEFVLATVKAPDAATLRGLERRFAEKLQIQPSYWSQIKGRSRQIGERLARQFEQQCRKPVGWMDQRHDGRAAGALAPSADTSTTPAVASGVLEVPAAGQPQDDDERFIVGLVLTYYRRHPQRARTRLLDLLGEVLTPPEAAAAGPAPDGSTARAGAARPGPAPAADDAHALWARSQAGVAPLKRKR